MPPLPQLRSSSGLDKMPAVLENIEVASGVYKHRIGINAFNGIVKVIDEAQNLRQLISDFPNALHDVEAVFYNGNTDTTIDISFTDTKNIDAKHNVYFKFGIFPWTLDATLAANTFFYKYEGLAAGVYRMAVTAVSATRESSNLVLADIVVIIP